MARKVTPAITTTTALETQMLVSTMRPELLIEIIDGPRRGIGNEFAHRLVPQNYQAAVTKITPAGDQAEFRVVDLSLAGVTA